ncbi:hypothetical protein [Bradyrhizobium sp. BR 10289]|uniref:hypothetical protein n=1 Tax=Bradyrhizobium sp. BR 10289 TaxID=2749993 RepID=UPI001C6506B3|nr:hypothetical protein [Bradyrhizobium sp. BR 10289]MBW7970096.1 hypothetical protein [Bradyrhizobium sp. BR 10289]
MGLKPAIMRDVPADVTSMRKVLGQKLGKQYAANPNVARYAFVLKFPDGVVTGRVVFHALGGIPTPRGPMLLAGQHFTVEAMDLAKAEGCERILLD